MVRRLRRAVVIDAPAPRVWRLLTDFEEWPRWGPSIRSVSAAAAEAGPGLTGHVRTLVGVSLPFEITHWVPGQEWEWKVAGIRATGHLIESLGPSSTRVTFTVPWPAAPYVAVLGIALRRLRRIAEAA